jgi:2-phospho-L-lactate/phosphoenolpyruvate guanylyltransferase
VSTWALVPVKAHGAGKQRLSGALADRQRTALVQVMLEQVLTALRGAGVHDILVLSPEPPALPQGVEHLVDEGRGLNEGLGHALSELGRRQAQAALIVFADLPLIEAADIDALLAALGAGMALAPDRSGSGTNALALTLPTPFRLQFGPGSCERHLAEAARLGQRVGVVRRTGLAFDIDEPADLAALRAHRDPRYPFLG